MLNRRLLVGCFAIAFMPSAIAQVPPAQPDGGMGGASSAGGSSGGGMTRDDELAQGVEAGHEGRPQRDEQNRREGQEAVEVDPTPNPRSPSSGGVPSNAPPGRETPRQ